MSDKQSLSDLNSRISRLEHLIERVPLRDLPDNGMVRYFVTITGGSPRMKWADNTFTSYVLQEPSLLFYYHDLPSVAMAYDPANAYEVPSSGGVEALALPRYPAGLGAGLLSTNGRSGGAVLVRHDFAGATGPLVIGMQYPVTGRVEIPVIPSDPTTYVYAYTVGWHS